MKARLLIDGGSRGNPGPAAYGYILESEDRAILAQRGAKIGTATNNVAEYAGLIAGLTQAMDFGVTDLEIVSDSELLVKQMTGQYKITNDVLREMIRKAIKIEESFTKIIYTHVGREDNTKADELVNKALDR